jgi:hypothetical protein
LNERKKQPIYYDFIHNLTIFIKKGIESNIPHSMRSVKKNYFILKKDCTKNPI